jgi:hypothetical protein
MAGVIGATSAAMRRGLYVIEESCGAICTAATTQLPGTNVESCALNIAMHIGMKIAIAAICIGTGANNRQMASMRSGRDIGNLPEDSQPGQMSHSFWS